MGEYLEFQINFPKGTKYGSAYQFNGIFNIFNGYCKSTKIWQENSWIKSFNFFVNNKFICRIELIDTWHLQTIDLSQFFKNEYANKNIVAPQELNNGAILKFEISEVFKGEKYKEVAISEFFIEGAIN